MISSRPLVDPRSLWSVSALSGRELRCLLDTGGQLRRASREGVSATPLRGRNLALLNDGASGGGAARLRRAALELGAKVAELRTQDTGIGPGADARATLRLLGRLYDAIDCEGLPPAVVEEIARETAVPVFNGLGATSPARAIAELLPLAERCGKPLDALRLAYLGDPATGCGPTLVHLAGACGIDLRDAPGDDVDLVIDARDGRPWAVPGVDAAERSANRHFTLQAMLLATMA